MLLYMSTIRVKTLSSKKHHQLSAGTETKVKFIYRESIIFISEYSSNLFVGANVCVPAYSTNGVYGNRHQGTKPKSKTGGTTSDSGS